MIEFGMVTQEGEAYFLGISHVPIRKVPKIFGTPYLRQNGSTRSEQIFGMVTHMWQKRVSWGQGVPKLWYLLHAHIQYEKRQPRDGW